MAIKVHMRRTAKHGAWGELNDILIELRRLAMSQPGYISGETFLSASNAGTSLVVAQWMSLKHWQDYELCAERRALLSKLESFLLEPATTEAYVETPVSGSSEPELRCDRHEVGLGLGKSLF